MGQHEFARVGHESHDLRLELTSLLRQRRRQRVEVDEHQTRQHLNPDGAQGIVGRIEPGDLVGVADPDHRAIEVVDPRVIRTHDAGDMARIAQQVVATMATHVVKCPDRTIVGPHYDDALFEHRRGEEVASFSHVGHMADEDPAVEEDGLSLLLEHSRVGVEAGRQRVRVRGVFGEAVFKRIESGVRHTTS